MKNEAEIIWWKTVKQDVETTPPGFTEAAARVEGSSAGAMNDGSIFKRGCFYQRLQQRIHRLY